MMSSEVEGSQTDMRVDGLVRNPFYSVHDSAPEEPPLWTYYNKPIILAVIGGLVLSTGIVMYLLSEFGVADVPHSMGPVCMSGGILFIIVALVLLPIIKDKLRRQGPKTRRVFHMEQVKNILLVMKESETDMENTGQGVGRCKFSFWFAVIHDILGFLILLSGVFWDIFFNDILIYFGSVIIFLSLIWWVFWYTGNIEVPPAELEDDITAYKRTKGISGVVRKVSARLSNGLGSFRKSGRASALRGTPDSKGTNSTNICMISYTNTQPLGLSGYMNREPLSI